LDLRTLYIGDTNTKDTKYYYELDESARNLYIGNYDVALEEKLTGVFYTSIADFQNQLDTMLQVCWRFDKIICRPPTTWSDLSVKDQTERFLKLLSLFKPIENFIIDSTRRKTEEPQIWVSGCSWSSAVGVAKEQRWGSLLADQINMAVTVLAEGGSGNSYQARKLLSADIRENDVVIFQVTVPQRETIIHPEYGQVHVNPSTYEQIPDLYKFYPPDRLDELTLVINQIRDMQNVVNFLQKTKTKFMFWSPGIYLPTGSMGVLLRECSPFKEYSYMYPDLEMVDFGTDGSHPGPLQHQEYAKLVLEKLKQREDWI
jgi:hypothetical protein